MLKRILTKEVLTVLSFGLCALAFLIASFDYTPTASLFPKIISAAVIFLALVFLAAHLCGAFGNAKAGTSVESDPAADSSAGRPRRQHWSVFMLTVGAYALLVYLIGFVVSTFLYSLGIPYLCGYGKTKTTIIFSLSIAIAMAVFAELFDIPLPMGLLFDTLIG